MTDSEIFKSLDGVEYGFWDFTKNKAISWYSKIWKEEEKTNNWVYTDTHCCVSKPEDLIKRKVGTCWDTSLYIKYMLDKNGYTSQMLWLEYCIPKEDENRTHTTVIYKDKSNLWCWMEYSWYSHRGIYKGLLNKDKLIKKIKDMWITDGKIKKTTYFNEDVPITNLLKLNIITFNDFLINGGSKCTLIGEQVDL